jgi:hypothetical protein
MGTGTQFCLASHSGSIHWGQVGGGVRTHPVGAERDLLLVRARDDLEAAVVHVHVVDGHEERLVLARAGVVVGRGVDVRVKAARAPGLLVVDLLLEEHGALAHQLGEDADEALPAEHGAEALVVVGVVWGQSSPVCGEIAGVWTRGVEGGGVVEATDWWGDLSPKMTDSLSVRQRPVVPSARTSS